MRRQFDSNLGIEYIESKCTGKEEVPGRVVEVCWSGRRGGKRACLHWAGLACFPAPASSQPPLFLSCACWSKHLGTSSLQITVIFLQNGVYTFLVLLQCTM